MTDFFKKLVLDLINKELMPFPVSVEAIAVREGKFSQQIIGGIPEVVEEISGNKIYLI